MHALSASLDAAQLFWLFKSCYICYILQGFAGELDFDAEMSGRRQQQQQQKGQRAGIRIQAGDAPNKKRQMKNAKFGFGGRKRLQKQNDAFSAADMSGYKPGKFDDGFGGKKGGGGGGGGGGGFAKKGGLGAKGGVKKGGKGGGNRPGKARRQHMKQRKG
jgi:rRNA-processing protein EBP2